MQRLFIVAVSVVLLTSLSLSTWAEEMSVTFLNPGGKNDPFFGNMVEFMSAVAEDLDIKLEVIYCDRNYFKLAEEGRKLARRKNKPDYVLLINENNAAVKILPELDKKGFKIFLFNEGFFNEYKEKFGKPGEKYPNWIGELLPDDYQSGFLLAEELIKQAVKEKKFADDNKLHMVGLGGVYKTNSSMRRVQGLKDAAATHGNVVVDQVSPAYYDQKRAKSVTSGLLRRYPKAKVVWSASDNMALGASEAITERGLKSGQDILTGGIDWADFAIKKVGDGEFCTTVGGHYMDGGWALIMLYDYHHNIAFPDLQMKSSFSALTGDNLTDYLTYFSNTDWSDIDFTRFSRRLNPQLQEYNFGLKPLFQQARKKQPASQTEQKTGNNSRLQIKK